MNVFSKSDKTSMRTDEVNQLLYKLRLPLSLVFTPINLKSEKEKFFSSDTYDPIFTYRKLKNNNSEILKRLASLKQISNVDPRISDFYIKLIESKKEANDLINAVGNNDIVTEISNKKYGRPSPLLFRNSARVLRGNVDNYNIVKYPVVKKEDLLDYKEIEYIFNKTFEYFNLDGWRVQSSSNIRQNGAKVGIKSKWVLVDPNIQRSKFKLKKTLVHEVGTHVLRSVNGESSGVEPLSNANLTSYLDVEEGLATWNESDMGLLTLGWLQKKAALTWAIYIGEKLTFRQLYNSLLGVFPKITSFDIAFSVKRGLGDTSYPGIYAKDVVYFRGFRKVKKALEKDKSLYEKLYAGKIDIDQCEWVDDGLIPKPKIVPTKEQWGEIFKKLDI